MISRRKLNRGLAASALSAAILGGNISPAKARIDLRQSSLKSMGLSPSNDLRELTRELATLEPPLLDENASANLYFGIRQLEKITARGGWTKVENDRPLKIGLKGIAVSKLRRRLIESGDLVRDQGLATTFDSHLAEAVKHFQQRHGLRADGIVEFSTFQALNVSAEQRIKQLQDNIPATKNFPRKTQDRYVMVNLPAATLEAVDNGNVAMRVDGIAGTKTRQSPVVSALIQKVNFNPFWTIPRSILEKDIIPKAIKNPDFLTSRRIKVSDWRGNEIDTTTIDWNDEKSIELRFRQEPYSGNSLGSVKIYMPNIYDVYLHDTPGKTLFGAGYRFHSSGCVRVSGIDRLVTWILRDSSEWNYSKVIAAMNDGETIDVSVPKEIPIYWLYITAWVSSNGVLQFRDDIYGFHKTQAA